MTFPEWSSDRSFLASIDIHELLPQQEPFVMVGRMIGFNQTKVTTETEISEDNIFTDNGYFSSSGLTENIAQTCAVRIGFIHKVILKEDVRAGLIGAVRNLHVIKAPSVGQLIQTTVEIQEEVFGMILAEATVVCEGETIVTAQIKLSLGKNEEA